MKKKKGDHHFEIVQAVVGLEFGTTDEPLLDYFSFISRQLPSYAAYFVHVLPEVDFFGKINELQPRHLIEEDELKEEIVRKLEQKIRERFPERTSVYVEYDVKEGDPMEEILKDCRSVKADLVVIGQKTGVRRHGILANRLARRSDINALVVPDKAKPSLQHIMVPVDFSENSGKALQVAARLNKELETPARISCVHVFEKPDLLPYRLSRTPEEMAKIFRKNREEAFDKFLQKYIPEDLEAVTKVMLDKDLPGLVSYLMDYAEKNETDLLVIGAKGHSRIERFLLGSVTEGILSEDSNIPVLVIK